MTPRPSTVDCNGGMLHTAANASTWRLSSNTEFCKEAFAQGAVGRGGAAEVVILANNCDTATNACAVRSCVINCELGPACVCPMEAGAAGAEAWAWGDRTTATAGGATRVANDFLMSFNIASTPSPGAGIASPP
ncbi:hypothetical protein NDU88_002752 [Pleurodeles waltl]|uniref:Uncharacterized protein n=1 Tax=Pleurodeles waltl TaxID=8319 RepID=A0AAV7SBE6_PLEWA|nr:hypothetical protein NDU88_002752 [Pleurodeles waltl]